MKNLIVCLLAFMPSIISANAQNVTEILNSYYKEFYATQKLAYNDRLPTREKIDSKYVNLLTSVVGIDEAERIIYETYINRIMESSEAKNLDLDKSVCREFAILRHAYDVEMYKVSKTSFSSDAKKSKISQLKIERNEKLKELLGADIYDRWLAFDKDTHRRYYMSFFGFTSSEYSKLVDIDNEYAVERMSALNRHLGHDEEDVLIDKAKATRVARIRDLLGEERFSKWYELYLVNEEFEKANGRR